MEDFVGAECELSSDQAIAIGESAFNYIMTGKVKGLRLGFRGVAFFGVAAALRSNRDVLYSDSSTLTYDQTTRLDEIETDMEEVAGINMQYYPFGHDRDLIGVGEGPMGYRSRSSLDAGVGSKRRRLLLHETRNAPTNLFELGNRWTIANQ